MPRRARVTPGGFLYHVLNRTVAGLPLFRKEANYEAFERIMIEAKAVSRAFRCTRTSISSGRVAMSSGTR
jgi:hypothetical protein